MDRPERIHVWYDEEGLIQAWGYVPASPDRKLVVEARPSGRLAAIELETPAEHFEDLHEYYRVDAAKAQLMPRASAT